jgi:putative transposase
MAYNSQRHHRRSIRLQTHDYASPGKYFITICTHDRAHVFGQILNDEMVLNEFGTIATQCWNELPEHFSHIRLDSAIVMPNHFHGIVWINQYPEGHCKTDRKFGDAIAGSIPTIVGAFKSATTRKINQLQNNSGATVWERNYYEHVIRDRESQINIQQYILNNPKNWKTDRFHSQ